MWQNIMDWIEYRVPFARVAKMHAIEYPAPKNMNFWYVFGFLATIVLGKPDRYRHLANHEFRTLCRACVRFC